MTTDPKDREQRLVSYWSPWPSEVLWTELYGRTEIWEVLTQPPQTPARRELKQRTAMQRVEKKPT